MQPGKQVTQFLWLELTVQRVRHVRPKTTNSNHNYYIYPDLLNVTPKFVADTFGSMVVADITGQISVTTIPTVPLIYVVMLLKIKMQTVFGKRVRMAFPM